MLHWRGRRWRVCRIGWRCRSICLLRGLVYSSTGPRFGGLPTGIGGCRRDDRCRCNQLPAGDSAAPSHHGCPSDRVGGADGTLLPSRYPVIASAIADGTLGVDSAAVIVKELDAASVRCSASAREVGEATLVEMAGRYTVADLRGLARQVRDRLDEDRAEPRDELHHKRRSCRFIALPDGMVRMLWDMPPEVARLAKISVDATVSQELPRAKDERAKHSSSTGGDSSDAGCDGSLLGDDDRTLDQLRSDAAERVFHQVASCKGNGGDIPSITMVIRMTKESLLTGLGIAQIDGIDETISPKNRAVVPLWSEISTR